MVGLAEKQGNSLNAAPFLFLVILVNENSQNVCSGNMCFWMSFIIFPLFSGNSQKKLYYVYTS